MKPWSQPARGRTRLPYALLALSLGVLVSCTTVAGDTESPTLRGIQDGGTEEAGSRAQAALTVETSAPPPSVLPTPSPAVSASPGPSPLARLLSDATPPSTVEPSVPGSTPGVAAQALPSLAAQAPSPGAVASSPPVGQAAAGTDVRLDAATTKKLRRILRNTVAKQGVAGLQAAVMLPSGETWLGSAGKAEMEPARPIAKDTQFAIASVTKTFIAALILQLAEEGKVDLDAPFGTYFEDAPRSKNVTLRQLLSHTSGIYNFWEHPRYGVVTDAWYQEPAAEGIRARDHEWTYEEMMGLVKSGYFKPGKDYHYSNTNYLILRQVAEAVEGAPIHQQLRQRFFEPLGMEHTVYQPAETPAADAAHGHWNTGSGYMDHTRDSTLVPFMAAVTVADAAGAMASTAQDLATWADALYGGTLLSPESLAEMTTMLQPGLYGLGTDVAVFWGHRAYGHRGGIRGYESSMWHFPQSGVSIVLLSNQGNWYTDEPMGKMVKAVLGKG